MNILHLHTNLNLTCGISKTIFLIAKYPIKGDKHFIIAFDGDAEKKFEDSKLNVKFLKCNRKKIIGIYRTFSYLRKFIKANNISILHSHHRYFDFISYLLSFFCKVNRVTSVQSFVYGKKFLSYKSPVLIAAGESVKKHLIENFKISEERIIVFNNFVDFNEAKTIRTQDEIIKELNVPLNSYLIGYVGRFSIKEKGIDILIDAFNIFKEKYENIYLIMVGEGEDIKKINIPTKVVVLSPRDNISDYYSVFNCLVLPSRIDPFPLTVLEAGIMKIPFIGSNVNGIREIITNGVDGLLFDVEDKMMLLEKMEMFYANRNLAGLCASGLYEKIKRNYECNSAIDFLNKIYEGL
jgi:glycosyltransferase involved in cell wall biosynthesis